MYHNDQWDKMIEIMIKNSSYYVGCDYRGCNKKQRSFSSEFDNGMCPTQWGSVGIYDDEFGDQCHYCPDHKNLFCIDDHVKSLSGCGNKTDKNNICTDSTCQLYLPYEKTKKYKEEYKDIWQKKSSYLVRIKCDHPFCETRSEKEYPVDSTGCPTRWGSAGVEIQDPDEQLHYCPEHKKNYCLDDLINGIDGCGVRLSDYGQCTTNWCEQQGLSDAQYEKDYKDTWTKNAGVGTFIYCDHCNKIGGGLDESDHLIDNGWEHARDNDESDFCPDCWSNENFCHKCGDDAFIGKYGQCTDCDATDEEYEKNYKNVWNTKKAINYFSLDQPNESIMPGMAQTQINNGITVDDASLDDGLDFGSSPNPNSGMEDNVTQNFPGMHDYERGLSSAASKQDDDLYPSYEDMMKDYKDAFWHGIDKSDYFRARTIDLKWAKQPITHKEILEANSVGAKVRDYAFVREMGLPHEKAIDAHNKGANLGEYGHEIYYGTPNEEILDALTKGRTVYWNKEINDYQNAWGFGKTSYYERITHCDECDKRSPDGDENLPRGWAKASGAEAGTAEYNHNNDEHYCEDCKKDRCLDEWDGYTMKNIGCGNKIGKFGQCPSCDRTDDQYAQEYKNIWNKTSYYERITHKNKKNSKKITASLAVKCDLCDRIEEIPYTGFNYNYFYDKGWDGTPDDQGPHFCPNCMENKCPDCFGELNKDMCDSCDYEGNR